MTTAPLVTLAISALLTPRYVQRLISEIAHQHQPKPLVPWALIFNALLIVTSTIVALPVLTFAAGCVSAVLTNYHLDVLGSPYWTVYSLNPLWSALGACLVATVARKQYHTESNKLVEIVAGLLNIAVTVPAASPSNVAADAALKMVDGQHIRPAFHQAIASARLPSRILLGCSVVVPLYLAITILHFVVADGVMRGHQAHEHFKEIKADDLTRDLNGKPAEADTNDADDQKVMDAITGKSLGFF